MKAKEVMVSPVVTAKPSSSVQDVARIFLEQRISAAPVVDDAGNLIGIVRERDFLRRVETETEVERSPWLQFFTRDKVLAAEYTKARARRVSDMMTRSIVTATTETPLKEIVVLLEENESVPILNAGRLVGIVSRSDLVQAVANVRKRWEVPLSDKTIRERILSHLNGQRWAHTAQLSIAVSDGVVRIRGVCRSDAERNAVRIAAENIPGVRAVDNDLSLPRMGPTS